MNAEFLPRIVIIIPAQKRVLIRDPKNSQNRCVIDGNEKVYEAIVSVEGETSTPWLLLPSKKCWGLPRSEWIRHWHEERIECRAKGLERWTDYFAGEPYE